MAVAMVIASRGTCDRKQVGAVIAQEGRPISWGYNGAPPGLSHCQSNHGWGLDHLAGKRIQTRDGLWVDVVEDLGWRDGPHGTDTINSILNHAAQVLGCRNSTHAEANALAFAAKQGISTDGCELFVTVSPCETCARLLIAAGIRRVWYFEQYRDATGIELLREAGVECQRTETLIHSASV